MHIYFSGDRMTHVYNRIEIVGLPTDRFVVDICRDVIPAQKFFHLLKAPT